MGTPTVGSQAHFPKDFRAGLVGGDDVLEAGRVDAASDGEARIGNIPNERNGECSLVRA